MKVDVAIVGGGLVGGTLAVALADAGVSVALVDARSSVQAASRADADTDFDQRVFALRPASRQFLESCGIWRHVDSERICPVHRMLVTGDDGASRLGFDAYRSGIAELAVIAESRVLDTAMRHVLHQRRLVTVAEGQRCEDVVWDDEGVTISLDDGQAIRAQLVVGGDGANSRVRDLAGIKVRESAYGHSAVVANFAITGTHQGTAWQWFRPDGVLALLPLPGKHVSMVWSTPQDHADELLGLSAEALAARVTQASDGVAGELASVGAAAAFALRLLRAESIVGPRLALVGDAAHNVHPLAGQGLNLGLADAQSLANEISQRGPDDIGSPAVLARYRRSRAEDIMAITLATDGLHRLFQSSAPGMAWLRNTGLRLTDRLAPIKRILVKHAAG